MSVELGNRAENLAALWLNQQGFQILGRNWRTRWCELDVIAIQAGMLHIVEVKYRSRSDFGSGFDYITANKIARLKRAAQMWQKANNRIYEPLQIDIIAITGSISMENLEYLPNALSW